MVSDITLGQYVPGKSVLHSMDPRAKILCIFTFIILVFCTLNYFSLGLMIFTTILFVLVSGVKFKIYIRSLKAVILIVIFTSVLNLFYGSGEPIFQFGFMAITMQGINNSIFVSLRIISLILVSSILTFTTTPPDLTDALERIMKPLKFFRVRVSEVAMMMTIALRFVPTFLEETDKIMSAQKSRGADLESGGITRRVKALIPILIPLFVSSFKRAYDLAIAMECRCYQGGNGRTRMKVLKLSKIDFIFICFTALLCLGVVICNIKFPQVQR